MTATRDFKSDDHLAVYIEVYNNMRDAAPHTVTVRADLRAASSVIVRSVSQEQRPSTALNRREGGYGFLSELPLEGITPGAYVIRVEASAGAGDQPTVSRDIPIRIR